MAPENARSRQNLAEQEGRIELAISALEKNEFPSIRRAAAVFDVPESTLRGRLRGGQYRKEQRANSHKLSETQEQALVR